MVEANTTKRNLLNETSGAQAVAFSFTHPEDVLHSPRLTTAEKRKILAEWASDASAVPNSPALRQLPSGAIVSIDAVLDALQKLDAVQDEPRRPETRRDIPAGSRVSLISRWRHPFHHHDHNDDDDPPPCPATALPPGVELELRRHRDAAWHLAAA